MRVRRHLRHRDGHLLLAQGGQCGCSADGRARRRPHCTRAPPRALTQPSLERALKRRAGAAHAHRRPLRFCTAPSTSFSHCTRTRRSAPCASSTPTPPPARPCRYRPCCVQPQPLLLLSAQMSHACACSSCVGCPGRVQERAGRRGPREQHPAGIRAPQAVRVAVVFTRSSGRFASLCLYMHSFSVSPLRFAVAR